MTDPKPKWLKSQLDAAMAEVRSSIRTVRTKGPSQVQFWLIALLMGILGGLAALGFRLSIDAIQRFVYRTHEPSTLHRFAFDLPWWWLVLVATCGGLLVGLILHFFTLDGRVRAVADVIEGAALREGRVDRKEGIASAFASLITLGTGGSAGREGPVVHLAAVISTYICRLMNANAVNSRDLLGCAVAAGVSASFNAPIAGAIFALEVVLRHFAVRAFAPIAIASVAGTVISRIIHGDLTEYQLSAATTFEFYVELPAFMLLGLFSGIIAFVLMKSIFFMDTLGTKLQTATKMPRYLRPAIAGMLLGLIATQFPHIIGVGYGITSDALTGRILFWQAIIFVIVKIIAVAITMGGRMGGGVFSPALGIGAMSGLAFGIVATGLLPTYSGSATLYALAGMGAVAAAVLGAPISTTLIVFELTGDWQTGLAVMVAVSLSTAISSRLVEKSFFLTQLERRNIHVSAGPQAYLLSTIRVGAMLRATDTPNGGDPERCEALVKEGAYIEFGATLDQAMPLFDRTGEEYIPIVMPAKNGALPEVRGALFHVDALRALNRAMAAVSAEEHS